MTSKFSIDNRELLQRISSGDAVVGIDFGNLIVRELAAFRLAAMDSEPVAYISKSDFDAGYPHILARRDFNKACTMPVYAAQPAPVVLDEVTAEDCPAFVNYDVTEVDEAWARGFNSCRAAMLATAPHDTHALNSVQSVDSVADRWIPVSERMPELGDWLVTDGCDFDVQLFNGEQFIPGFVWEDKITHWMPLPAVPQEVKGE